MYAHRSQPSVLVQEVVVINHGVCTQTSVPYYKCHVPITRLRSLVKLFNPFAPEPPVTAHADPGPFYPL